MPSKLNVEGQNQKIKIKTKFEIKKKIKKVLKTFKDHSEKGLDMSLFVVIIKC